MASQVGGKVLICECGPPPGGGRGRGADFTGWGGHGVWRPCKAEAIGAEPQPPRSIPPRQCRISQGSPDLEAEDEPLLQPWEMVGAHSRARGAGGAARRAAGRRGVAARASVPAQPSDDARARVGEELERLLQGAAQDLGEKVRTKKNTTTPWDEPSLLPAAVQPLPHGPPQSCRPAPPPPGKMPRLGSPPPPSAATTRCTSPDRHLWQPLAPPGRSVRCSALRRCPSRPAAGTRAVRVKGWASVAAARVVVAGRESGCPRAAARIYHRAAIRPRQVRCVRGSAAFSGLRIFSHLAISRRDCRRPALSARLCIRHRARTRR